MDLFTLLMTSAASCGLALLSLWLVQRGHPDREGLPWLTGHLALAGLALGGIGLRGVLPGWVSITLSNLLLTSAYITLVEGATRFGRVRRPPLWLYAVALSLTAVMHGYFGLVRPHVLGRMVWHSLMVLVVYVIVGRAFLRLGRGRWVPARWLGLLMLVHAGFHTFVGASALLRGLQTSYLANQGMAWVLQLEGLVAVMGFALLLPQQLAHELQAKLRDEARQDPLTGLLNRRGFDEAAGRVLGRAEHAGLPVALALGDLDHFKQVNDRFGHPVGDAVLVEVGRRLELAVRPGDLVARYGGEEFVVLLVGLDAAAAVAFADRLREALAVDPLEVVAGEPIRSSWGVVVQRRPRSLEILVAEADRHLYLAKRKGRDRVVTGPLPELPR